MKIKIDRVYDIHVYTFVNSNGVQFQLTFEKSFSGNFVIVRLVNLTGSSQSLYCNKLRKIVRDIVYNYLLSNSCMLFFDIKLSSFRKYILLTKLLRWIELENEVRNSLRLDYRNGNLFVEVYLSIN